MDHLLALSSVVSRLPSLGEWKQIYVMNNAVSLPILGMWFDFMKMVGESTHLKDNNDVLQQSLCAEFELVVSPTVHGDLSSLAKSLRHALLPGCVSPQGPGERVGLELKMLQRRVHIHRPRAVCLAFCSVLST